MSSTPPGGRDSDDSSPTQEIGGLDGTLPVSLDDRPKVPSSLLRRAPGEGLPPGTIIGEHVVMDALGEGGMGVVYRAAPVGGGPRVALKWVAGRLSDESGRLRFAREAETAMRLAHPNVVRVLGFGQTDDDGLYLLMELLEGEDLDHRLRRGTLAPSEVVRLGCEAASALAAAHEGGVVHRDIKPSNLFLLPDGTLKVLDFGIALSVADVASGRLTGSALALGTPAYMAPEQAQGRRDEDPRTDIWGLGATLYHAIAGRPPFLAPTVFAQVVRVATEEPDPLPESVPPWMAAVLMRALRRDRDRRWPSMQAFAHALQQGLAQPAAATIPASVPLQLGAEVRIVAVLLAERVADVDRFRASVEGQGGRGLSLLARRAVGLFGGDTWRGDEAERAVRAGLTLRRDGPALRLGVATGRAVRADAGAITGAVVASAEAVLSSAGVGVDPETARRIRGGFDLETRGPAEVALAEGHGRILGVRGPGGADLPLLGRDREMADLRATLEAVVQEGQADALLLVGPPGIGKSRMLHQLRLEIAARSPADVQVLEARGEAHRVLQGWHAIAGALRLFAGVQEGTAPAEIQRRLLSVCPTRSCAEFIGEILGAGFEETAHLRTARADATIMRDRVVVAVGDLVEALSLKRPVVLTVEDVQWVDAPTVRLLEILLHRLEDRRLFIVALSRPDATAALTDFRRVVLGGISRASTRALVQAVLGESDPAQVHAASIHDRTGGNPYFVEELALAVRAGIRELPTSVEAAVQARLDGLPREEKDVLRRASVFGRRFWSEALVAIGVADPESHLAALRRRDLVIEESRARLAHTTEWRFRHAVTQEVAYASLTDEQRANLHRAAASWLAERTDTPALETARHLERAGDHEAALPYWKAAVEAALAEGDSEAALEASDRVLAHDPEPDTAFVLRRQRVELLHFLGQAQREEAEIDALTAVAHTATQRAVALTRRSGALRLRSRFAEALAVALEGLAESPDSEGLLVCRALAAMDGGDTTQGIDAATRAVAASRAGGDPVQIAVALAGEAHCHAVVGDIGAAMAPMREALTLLEVAGEPRRIAAAVGHLAYYSLCLGDHQEAMQGLHRSIEMARAAGNRGVEGFAWHNLGLARAGAGDVEGGLEAEATAVSIAETIDEPRLRLAAMSYRAKILLDAGRLEAAEATIEGALAQPAGVLANLAAPIRALRTALLVARGQLEQARVQAVDVIALRDAAGGMEAFEADLFLAADAAGVPGALQRGLALLLERAARISDPAMRASFLEHVPEHAALVARARAVSNES